MRISDWSSDVCSSDLFIPAVPSALQGALTSSTGRYPMKHSVALSLATLSTTLLLSLAANAHDPKAFDQMMEAAPAATVSACDELEVKQQEGASDDTDIKDLKARCDAEKKAENASRSEEHTSEIRS